MRNKIYTQAENRPTLQCQLNGEKLSEIFKIDCEDGKGHRRVSRRPHAVRQRQERLASLTIARWARITKKQIGVLSLSPVRLLIRLHRSLVHLLGTTRFARELCCTHSLRSFTPELVGQ